MPPQGGLSDKIGNRYEGRIAIWRLLQLIDEQHPSVKVRFEQPGDEHFEWWVQNEDGARVYTQVKRQQAPDQEWKIGTLISRGVLPAFGSRLREEPSARCEFLSTLSASHLQDLTESALLAADLNEFETQFAAAAGGPPGPARRVRGRADPRYRPGPARVTRSGAIPGGGGPARAPRP